VTGDTGYFWFFSEDNVELAIKVLDGRAVNDAYWIFVGSLSSIQYVITVTNMQTGAVRSYWNAPDQLASIADTEAFGEVATRPVWRAVPVGRPRRAIFHARRWPSVRPIRRSPTPMTPWRGRCPVSRDSVRE
jgi:hypothetical protein